MASPFFEWLLASAGLDAACYRPACLERRLGACLRALKIGSVEAAWDRLRDHPELLPVAVNAVLLGVTEFFRDPSVFAELGWHLDRAGASDGLRIWSAACSNGAELYSVAMLLAERGLLARSALLGTDCRPDAIRAARVGAYDRGGLGPIARARLERFFEISGSTCRVVRELREKSDWRVGDIFGPPPEDAWDVILCRNTAIYLESKPARRLWSGLRRALRPGGILVTGRAERPCCGEAFEQLGNCIYRKA